MDLILWRHAQAEELRPGKNDLDRALTKKGQSQAKAMADWLNRRLSADARILCSPALRTRQTADALHRFYEVTTCLAPETGPENLIIASEWPNTPHPTLLIGHQPSLGQLAALLLSGTKAFWAIKKGAIWWITLEDKCANSQASLRVMLPPDFLES
jgi:phosphohistidine phosphatase